MAIVSKKQTWPNHFPNEKLRLESNPRKSMHTTKVTFHTFSIGDCEDPVLYAAYPISEWQQTEKGKWCCDNAEGEIVLHTFADPITFGYKAIISGSLNDKNLTYYKLKWETV